MSPQESLEGRVPATNGGGTESAPIAENPFQTRVELNEAAREELASVRDVAFSFDDEQKEPGQPIVQHLHDVFVQGDVSSEECQAVYSQVLSYVRANSAIIHVSEKTQKALSGEDGGPVLDIEERFAHAMRASEGKIQLSALALFGELQTYRQQAVSHELAKQLDRVEPSELQRIAEQLTELAQSSEPRDHIIVHKILDFLEDMYWRIINHDRQRESPIRQEEQAVTPFFIHQMMEIFTVIGERIDTYLLRAHIQTYCNLKNLHERIIQEKKLLPIQPIIHNETEEQPIENPPKDTRKGPVVVGSPYKKTSRPQEIWGPEKLSTMSSSIVSAPRYTTRGFPAAVRFSMELQIKARRKGYLEGRNMSDQCSIFMLLLSPGIYALYYNGRIIEIFEEKHPDPTSLHTDDHKQQREKILLVHNGYISSGQREDFQPRTAHEDDKNDPEFCDKSERREYEYYKSIAMRDILRRLDGYYFLDGSIQSQLRILRFIDTLQWDSVGLEENQLAITLCAGFLRYCDKEEMITIQSILQGLQKKFPEVTIKYIVEKCLGYFKDIEKENEREKFSKEIEQRIHKKAVEKIILLLKHFNQFTQYSAQRGLDTVVERLGQINTSVFLAIEMFKVENRPLILGETQLFHFSAYNMIYRRRPEQDDLALPPYKEIEQLVVMNQLRAGYPSDLAAYLKHERKEREMDPGTRVYIARTVEGQLISAVRFYGLEQDGKIEMSSLILHPEGLRSSFGRIFFNVVLDKEKKDHPEATFRGVVYEGNPQIQNHVERSSLIVRAYEEDYKHTGAGVFHVRTHYPGGAALLQEYRGYLEQYGEPDKMIQSTETPVHIKNGVYVFYTPVSYDPSLKQGNIVYAIKKFLDQQYNIIRAKSIRHNMQNGVVFLLVPKGTI